jgi:hypothetical protein
MIPSRKIFVVILAVAGVAGFVTAFGRLADGPGETSGVNDATRTTAAQERMAPLLTVTEWTGTEMTAQEAIEAHASAAEGPVQPIPFNHRFHVREIGMQCAYCHGGAESSAMAPIPPVELCMGCHRIVGGQLEPVQELRGYWDRGEPIPWERVYKLPDFVQFPHEAHIRNDLQCAECHGPVEDMDRIRKATPLSMGWCLECHMGEGQEADYATDRLLARDYPPPPMPEGRQSVGLYPQAIDQRYGATRGPIDCTACHY